MTTPAALLGSLALVAGLTSYALPDDVWLRRINLLCCAAWAGHFVALHDVAGASMMGLAMVMIGARTLHCPTLSRAAWLVNVTVASAALAAVATGQMNWRTLLPVMGAFCINTAVSYYARHGLTALVLVGELLWLGHAFAIGSIFAAVSTVIGLAALAVRTRGLRTRIALR